MKPKSDEIVRTTLRLPHSLLNAAKIQAIKENTSLQDLIVRLLENYVKGKTR
jgi:predicted DNA binding CopG/RHH family protein